MTQIDNKVYDLYLKLKGSKHLRNLWTIKDGICRFTIEDLDLDVEVFESDNDENSVMIYVKGVDEDNMSWEHGLVSADELLSAVCSDTLNGDLFFL